MCDTFVKNSGGASGVFFGKNSDRDPDEPQILFFGYADLKKWERETGTPKASYAEGPLKVLRRVYTRFQHPYRALISRPSWMWGAEMGVNERGVAIGNEAVFSRKMGMNRREKAGDSEGLLGMDILRLALHNGRDATEAVHVVTSLIEREGQGGNGAYRGRLFYDNAFLISDGRLSYVLETAGRRWAVRGVTTDSISNVYSIGVDFQSCDSETSQQASYHTSSDSRVKGSYSFTDAHESRLYPWVTRGAVRRDRARVLLDTDRFTLKNAFGLLRDHGGAVSPKRGMGNLCMHSGWFIRSETTASMVVEWKDGVPVVWITGTPNPCVSLFQPWMFPAADTEQEGGGGGPHTGARGDFEGGPVFSDYTTGEKLFEHRRTLVRGLVKGFGKFRRRVLSERESMEEGFSRRMDECIQGHLRAEETSRVCLQEADRYYRMVEEILGVNPG